MKKNTPGGAYGRNGRGGHDQRQQLDKPRVKVSAFYPQCLDFLRDERGVHVGRNSTRFDCYLCTENGILTARFITDQELSLPKQPDFKFMAGEEYYPDDQAAQVVVTQNGKILTPEMVKVLRNDRGQARYPGLRYMAVIKCNGNALRFLLCLINFVSGSRKNDSIALNIEKMEITIPGSLQARFFGQREPQYTLEEVETAIEQHLAAMVDVAKKNGDEKTISQAMRTQENATPFIRPMAVSYLMAIGAEISMQDVPDREITPVAEEMTSQTDEATEATETETIEPVADTGIAEAQAAIQSEEKKTAKRRKPAKKKAAAKKTGTDG